MFFGRRKHGQTAALAEPRPEVAEADRLVAEGDLPTALSLLERANRAGRDTQIERTIRWLRHRIGIELLGEPSVPPEFVKPSADLPPLGEQSRVPEVTPRELTPEVLRGAILTNGCLLIRGLLEKKTAKRMAEGIDRAFTIREGLADGESDPDGYYDELVPEDPFVITERPWVAGAGGVLAADSPRLMFDMLEAFNRAGLGPVIESYLGERAAISAQKCTLRKATPEMPGAWHQDGKFLGDVRSLNVWISLSRCGDVAPSMDIVPRRIDRHLEAGENGALDIQVSQARAEEAAGDAGIVRPIFDPGDALLFDDLFLHQTGSDPEMPKARYAIESWFFGPSKFPAGYVPVAF